MSWRQASRSDEIVRYINDEKWIGVSFVTDPNWYIDGKCKSLAKKITKYIRKRFKIKCRVFVLPEGGMFGAMERYVIGVREDDLEVIKNFIESIQYEYDVISSFDKEYYDGL